MNKHASLFFCLTTSAVLALTNCSSSSKGGAGGDFCTLARSYEKTQAANSDAIFGGQSSPATAKKAFDQVGQAVAAMVGAAPAQIKKDAQTLQGALRSLKAIMEKNNYDFTKIGTDPTAQAAFGELNTEEVQQASANIEEYLSSTCGITTTTTA